MIRYWRGGVNISLSGVAGFPARQRNTFTNKKGVCGMSTYFHNKSVGGIARVILSVALAVVFTVLVLTGCAKDDYGSLLDSKLICANGEAWMASGNYYSMIFSENEEYAGAIYNDKNGTWEKITDTIGIKWRTKEDTLIWFEIRWGELNWDYANELTATYRISGDTLTLNNLRGNFRGKPTVREGTFIKGKSPVENMKDEN
jgi:hypothetical protein